MEKEKQQEYLIRLSLLEQKAQQIEQQLQQIEQQIMEFRMLKINLEEIWKKRGSEILAPVSNGIFLKSELKKEEFIVDVGAKIFLKKDLEGARDVIDKNIKRLEKYKNMMLSEIEGINKELSNLLPHR
jgi:prefoldin alpha subunit